MPAKIYKRDGRLVRFEPEKISAAMQKAFSALRLDGSKDDSKILNELTRNVVADLDRKFYHKIPKVEDVQDIVEQVLIKSGYERTAKAYIDYRRQHAQIRDAKRILGVASDELKLSVNAISVLEKRYLLKDDAGNVIETPQQMFRRVAREVARIEARYAKKDAGKTEEEFYRMMAELEFIPNSPTLMNAGTRMGQLSACFVLPVEDSMEGIFTTLKHMALIHQSGGGTGFSFSSLRPSGDLVGSTKCPASGPVSFMRVFDCATDVIKQGGRRRGANMGVLRVDHPDVMEFVTAKKDPDNFQNFNLSVAVTDAFMKAAQKGAEYELINPRTGASSGRHNAKDVMRLIVTMAWHNGDPGIIFIDEMNRRNPTPAAGEIESTNPCGEQPLLPYESCNLGSINLAKFAEGCRLDWKRLEKTARLAVRFLDNVIDANNFPLDRIEEATKANRKIGLGVMGFADMLIRLKAPYNSQKAVRLAEDVMKFIREKAVDESQRLAEERGSFPNFKKSALAKKYKRMRNASVTTVAPTGTISIIAGCSSGIEPLFGVSFVRNVMSGAQLLETNADFELVAKQRGFYSKDIMMDIAQQGTVQNVRGVPKDVKDVFVTSSDISPEWHIKIQAAFQRYTDSAVSKTINFPSTATIEDIEKAYALAHRLRCKGITVYRYGSREGQVLTLGEPGKKTKVRYMGADSEYAGGCPTGECPF
ncbi:vitamin B12-dependent ribonucleotide reductase [Candidatus Woesearchaeota archaeon]|nr:vitamin B12-dependent ribonucleotide reductase [Candidatus Woesearchaeota archaeon]